VVAADIDVLREVAGEDAVFVPPGDDEALAAALERIVEDSSLREKLVAAGRERAAAFTWERTARKTIDAYRRALS
jgi:glycosyltransferase involved in cell wall biosynthesis